LENYLCSGNEAYEQGRFEEAKEFYQKIIKRGEEIYQEAEAQVREQIAFEERLKGYDDLAKVYYKEGKLEEAKALWERLIREAKKAGIE
ncbi:MAG: tetratricopeptide repeat protein, partial [Candidatus Ratteibacteria bacterium]|nr:tetratricopeptide repeat protein [Candidatus Ratteibacteria bacterium]